MATDRLRRRLRDVDADELADLTESFCVVGTPLPDLNGWKKDQNELKPIWQQEARDEQGRRRFHGAFTGGFSAGYFNTVGSKEDGRHLRSAHRERTSRPASSRSKQSAIGLRISWTRRICRTGEPHNKFQPLQRSVKASTMIANLLVFDSQAELVRRSLIPCLQRWDQQQRWPWLQLLRKMGWKDGQGLGPRVDAKKRARLLSMVSSSNDASLATSSKVTLEDLKHLYAPPPTPVLSYASNQGSRRGLGARRSQTCTRHSPVDRSWLPPSLQQPRIHPRTFGQTARPLPPGSDSHHSLCHQSQSFLEIPFRQTGSQIQVESGSAMLRTRIQFTQMQRRTTQRQQLEANCLAKPRSQAHHQALLLSFQPKLARSLLLTRA